MRIDLGQAAQPLPENDRTGKPGASNAETRPAASSSRGEDQAQLSGGHAKVHALAAEVLQFPEIRQEKVNALRQVVLEGSYRPSPNQVADAVFAHMLARLAA
jgi:flagellar biosynthesis anti-sigma factor FlgM